MVGIFWIKNLRPYDPNKDIKQLKNPNNKLNYKIISDIKFEYSWEHLDMLWKISLAYKDDKIGWQSYLTAITHGKHPEKSIFSFPTNGWP